MADFREFSKDVNNKRVSTHTTSTAYQPHNLHMAARVIVSLTANMKPVNVTICFKFNGFLTVHHCVELKFTTNLMHNFLFIQ
jgi:hypothetical protein